MVRFRKGAPQNSRSGWFSDQSWLASRSPDRQLTVVLDVEGWHSASPADCRWHADSMRRRLLLNSQGLSAADPEFAPPSR
jgi:hypothetical protein